MMPLGKLSFKEMERVRIACAYLFSPELAKNDEFLFSLDIASVRAAFRAKAKRYHPDIRRGEPRHVTRKRKERFIKIKESYETLKCYLVGEDEPLEKGERRERRVIAVGGAKGGVGKSLFAANLAVFLAKRGYSTTVVDLDLGGANLHLFLGETFLRKNINDFLAGRAQTLGEVSVPSKYGPRLIGGDSSQFGAANIHFSRKIKLIKALDSLDSDRVVVDLGGDTSFNVLDFFLKADRGIVLTTCDPASYLDAYSFIKVAFLRRLLRIFGPESESRAPKDHRLMRIIEKFADPSQAGGPKSVAGLIEEVRKKRPVHLGLIRGVLRDYNPKLIINMTTRDSNPEQVAARIKEVAEKLLSVKVDYLGTLPFEEEVQQSARDLVPAVARFPAGALAKTIESVAGGL